MTPVIHDASPDEILALAGLWHAAWHDAHAALVPEALTRMRTRESFAERLARDLALVRVVGQVGMPQGFCMVKGNELYQLFVAAAARRGGVASALAVDAEARIRANGHARGILDCAIGNDSAAAFYRALGWTRTGTVMDSFETSAGGFEMEVWRFEKPL